MREPAPPLRAARGGVAHARGIVAENLAAAALEADGWTVLARRLRTEAGEIDLVARRDAITAFIEVKARPTLTDAASALTPRQRARLLAAAEASLAENPDWSGGDIRFDVIVVDALGTVRRITDAFRDEGL